MFFLFFFSRQNIFEEALKTIYPLDDADGEISGLFQKYL